MSSSSLDSDSEYVQIEEAAEIKQDTDDSPIEYAQIPPESKDKGQLVYIFNKTEDQSEFVVLKKICMKYGLQAWDEMLKYLPWRTRASLRTTLCRMLKKQALSEYGGIRADPFQISSDNSSILREGQTNQEYKMKAGMLVNLKWNRSKDDINRIKEENIAKYEISEEEADKIEIPIIISLEFMRQQLEHRRNSLLLYRAALLNEMRNRKMDVGDDLQIQELHIIPTEQLRLPKAGKKCKVDFSSSYVKVESVCDTVE